MIQDVYINDYTVANLIYNWVTLNLFVHNYMLLFFQTVKWLQVFLSKINNIDHLFTHM